MLAEIPLRGEYHFIRDRNESTMLVALLMVWADKETKLIQLDPKALKNVGSLLNVGLC
jgi:hypothetical protein